MNRYLLDTNVVLIGLTEPATLRPSMRAALRAGENILSVVSYWEVVLKCTKGKLDVGNPRSWWDDALAQLVATALPLHADHVTALSGFPSIHQDPFDRILIAQAIVEDLILVTTDHDISRYSRHGLRVLR